MSYELTKDLETGNQTIDSEHRKLFQIVNQLLDACADKDPMTTLKPVILFLISYVKEHFKHEEELLERGGYPDLEAHKAFHESYKERLRQILVQIPPSGPTVSDIVSINSHISVLVNHIREEDKKMCGYIKES